jgi:hypothetical protein
MTSIGGITDSLQTREYFGHLHQTGSVKIGTDRKEMEFSAEA